jgi:hypothetical protein
MMAILRHVAFRLFTSKCQNSKAQRGDKVELFCFCYFVFSRQKIPEHTTKEGQKYDA